MNDNVIDFQSRRRPVHEEPLTVEYPFQGTVLENLGRKACDDVAILSAWARDMQWPVRVFALVDTNWPASEVMEQLQVLLLREPRNNATLTRADGTVIGDSEFLFHHEPCLESHATTIEEACEGGAVFEFDPITGWSFDVKLEREHRITEINAGGLLELQDQVGAVPLNYSPAMADAVLEMFRSEPQQPRMLAELLHRDRIVHFPPPGTIDARGQLLVYWVLRELELNPEYMQVIDLAAERFPLGMKASQALNAIRANGEADDAEAVEFLRRHGFIVPAGNGWELAQGARNLYEIHPYFAHYGVLGMLCKELDERGDLHSIPAWDPSTRYQFAEFDFQAYAREMGKLGEKGQQPRP